MDPQVVQAVDQIKLAGSVAPVDMSVFSLFGHADIVGKVVMFGLLIVSVFTWALIFDKISKISRLKGRAGFFEERFWSSGSLEIPLVQAVTRFTAALAPTLL